MMVNIFMEMTSDEVGDITVLFLGMITGCLTSYGTEARRRRPPPRSSPTQSMNGSSL